MLIALEQGKWLVIGVLVDKWGTAVQATGVPRPQVVMTTGRVCYGYCYGWAHERRTLTIYNLYHIYGMKYALNDECNIYAFQELFNRVHAGSNITSTGCLCLYLSNIEVIKTEQTCATLSC